MGQQQLLLIVLGAIIVGIAVVVGINMFGSSAEQANIDAVRSDVLTLASSAQAFYKKPAMLGGGGNTFQGLNFKEVNFPVNDEDLTNGDMTAENANGEYTITVVGDDSVSVEAVPKSDSLRTMTAGINPGGIHWD